MLFVYICDTRCLCYIFYDKILNYLSFPRLLDFMLRKNIDQLNSNIYPQILSQNKDLCDIGFFTYGISHITGKLFQ